jgi:Signal transduction histidine kinase
MKTQQKLLIVLLFSLFIFLLSIVIAFYFNKKREQILIQSNIVQLSDNIEALIQSKTEVLKAAATDYTFWDEMVNFVSTKDKKWANENIVTMVHNYKVDHVLVYNAQVELVYQASVDSSLLSIPNSELKMLIDSLQKNRLINTFTTTPEGLIQIIATTIHPTNDPLKKTTPKGYFFIGKHWPSSYLSSIGKIIGMQLSLTKERSTDCLEYNNFHVYKPLYNINKEYITSLHATKGALFVRDYQSTNNFLAIVILTAFVIMLGLFWLTTTYWVKRPLMRIESIMATESHGEIEKLKGMGEEYRQIGEMIEHSILQKEELSVARDRAEESDQLKTAFLTNISHEFRTPMNGIIGFSSLLSDLEETSDIQRKYIRNIENCSQNLLKVVTDILDISKIQLGQVSVNYEEFSVDDLFTDLYWTLRSNIELLNKPDLKLNFTRFSDDKRRFIYSDRECISQILNNLIENAIKFTEKGYIAVKYQITETDIIFSVEDTGIGISPDDQAVIFEYFRKLYPSDAEKLYGGIGLGLSICQGLVNLLNGKIGVSSQLGAGATFWVAIPSIKN